MSLSVLREQIYVHTDRKPDGEPAVLGSMATALAAHGEAGLDFARRLVGSLHGDSETRPINLGVASFAEQLTEDAADPGNFPAIRAGSLAVLAAMSMIYHPTDGDPHRTVGAVGREMLLRLRGTGRASDLHAFLDAALDTEPVDPYDLAVDLAELPYIIEEKLGDSTPARTGRSDEHQPGPAAEVEEVVELDLRDIELNDDSRLIDWLDPSLDEIKTIAATPIMRDGRREAYLVDLTAYNHDIAAVAEELRGHSVYPRFQERLLMTIMQYLKNPAQIPRLLLAELPTYYSKNVGAGDRLTRGYFATIGRVGDLRVVALLAAARGKDNELSVLGVLTGGRVKSFHDRR